MNLSTSKTHIGQETFTILCWYFGLLLCFTARQIKNTLYYRGMCFM